MARFYYKQFEKQVTKRTAKTDNAVFLKVKERVEDAKEKMASDYLSHPVTKEIQNGANDPVGALNITNTLKGADGKTKGNLFTFIGFDKNPLNEGLILIEDGISLVKNPTSVRQKDNKTIYTYQVNTPTPKDYSAIAPMPHWSGGSWITAIEKGISGFGSYIYWKIAGRSGGGLQAKIHGTDTPQKLRDREYNPKALKDGFFTGLLEGFVKSISSKRDARGRFR